MNEILAVAALIALCFVLGVVTVAMLRRWR